MELKKKIVVYTCITGDYDELLEPEQIDPQVDYLCVSDKPLVVGSAWQYLPIPSYFSNAVNSRFIKMHPHILFPEYEISIYVDGNIRILAPVAPLAAKAVQGASVSMYHHPYRDCAYQEALECAAIGLGWCWRISAQMNRYRRSGFPKCWGLFEANIIIRTHNKPECKMLMELWWKEYLSGTRRDQLSLTYLAWKNSVAIHDLGTSDARGAKLIFALLEVHNHTNFINKIRARVNKKMLSFLIYLRTRSL